MAQLPQALLYFPSLTYKLFYSYVGFMAGVDSDISLIGGSHSTRLPRTSYAESTSATSGSARVRVLTLTQRVSSLNLGRRV
jgi:hypothetical protein